MRAFLVYVALTALTLAVFALRPDLDLAVAHLFYDHGGFIGQTGFQKFARTSSGTCGSSSWRCLARCGS